MLIESFQKKRRILEDDINQKRLNSGVYLIAGVGLEAIVGVMTYEHLPIWSFLAVGTLGVLSFYRSYKNSKEARSQKTVLKDLFKNKK